jgi:methyl-accepting chemotaxis protein
MGVMGSAKGIARAIGNSHVTTKLMAAFSLMVGVTVLVSFEGVHSAAMLDGRIQTLFTEDLTGISAIKEAAIFQVKATRVLRDLVLANGDKETIDDQKQTLAELESSVDEWLSAAQQAFSDSQSQAKLVEIKRQIPALRALSGKVAASASAGDQSGALAALKEANSLSNQINLSIAQICRLREAAANESRTQCERTYHTSRATIVGCTIFSVLFAGALCLLTVRMIARPLLKVMATLQKASSGDLTQRLKIENEDEIGTMGAALNAALESTRSVLQKVRETTGELGKLSTELATAADGMSTGAEAQAASLEKTSANLEEIASSARSNAKHARQASKVARDSREVATKGHGVVAAAVHAMSDINESSEKISRIVSVVDEVAFQTNMLSVNAAIEAARAGENGQSFGVVAAEIRNLSRRSTDSARGIRDLIEASLHTVENGAAAIRNSGETLDRLSSSVNDVTDFIAQIVTATEEQSAGVDQVHSAVLQMDRVTQDHRTQAAKLSSAAATLSTETWQLQAMLERFTLEGKS